MTALANKICENEVLGLVTDNLRYHEYARAFKLDNNYIFRDSSAVNNNPSIGQGLLLDLIIEDLRICPDTSFDDLIKFKEKYQDELTAFRVQLANLTQSISADQPINIMRKQIAEVYKIFKVDYNNLKKALKGSRIRWVANNFLKVASFVGGTIVTASQGVPIELSLLAGAGISATVSLVTYKLDKGDQLRSNPYSYLLAVDRMM